MTRTDAAAPPAADTRLRVRTVPVDETAPLVPRLDPRHPLLWMRRGEGMIGLGEVLRIETAGPDRVARAADGWRRLAAAADVDDRVGLPGSGLVAFGAIAFADESAATSVLVVPEIVIGRRDGRAWVTRIELLDATSGASGAALAAAPVELPEPAPKRDVPRVRFSSGTMPPEAYMSAVADAVGRIDDGRFEKVVLAREIVGQLQEDAGLRAALAKLADDYPDTWVFAVDGLIGASPETLVRVDHGTVSARVLAGTASRGRDATSDRAQAARLADSPKDRAEHALAVESAVATLAPHTARLDASPEPFTLQLPNLWHLATDLKGTLGDGSSSLDLVEAVHPTAAVAGTPREVALRAIAELEGFDRGRYAGPVGWIDADGDGEWAIALRCAQVSPDGTVRAYAGCGIVHDSVPADELAETDMKFRPIVEAFGAPPPSPPIP
ncbi:menaquinone-specific isochorismate synthase [Agromyces flavus]|uniref:isochorismate synthase n=1 Tax=Agromyces flavus TaxID=589382 RepID=A0A1H1XTZ7_9MICO|nr:isochorismate synthase [Agromyces flavus]MCP2366506.1 menaquinone-specific isochorismate synthase [Agromyces flavus]GGI44812.1 isochorismate synthase [Agromyces flavus]SDT12501.1 isochorismate synthase [Agromyces flavus]